MSVEVEECYTMDFNIFLTFCHLGGEKVIPVVKEHSGILIVDQGKGCDN